MDPHTQPPKSPAAPGMGATPAPAGYSERAVESTRNWINQHGALVVVGCVGLLLLSWTILPHAPPRQPPPKYVYYLDPHTELLIAGPAMAIPPIDVDGRAAVRVHVFACADCAEPFIAYYEKYSPEAKQRLEEISQLMQEEGYFSELDGEAYELQASGRFVSSDNVTWVLAESWEGRRVLRGAEREECPEGKYIACYPTEADL